ncbi:MAG: hypothetical protein QNJ49_03305 [Mastigocoleus sp. MO_167.B18]|nr:hypothetical protein [Mastigocoleus sp. MO_167.B18]
MVQGNPEFWAKARRAQNELVEQFLNHPDVSLIDIGYAPEENQNSGEIVLRIHVRDRWIKAKLEERITFPTQVEGIPVIVIPGEYEFE